MAKSANTWFSAVMACSWASTSQSGRGCNSENCHSSSGAIFIGVWIPNDVPVDSVLMLSYLEIAQWQLVQWCVLVMRVDTLG